MRKSVSRMYAAMLVAGLCLACLSAVSAEEDDIRFLRIGTGATGGTYFHIGGLIASMISNPPGSRPCEEGGSCGVPGVIAAAVSTEGSVDNLLRVAAGELDMALSQADVTVYAYTGSPPFSAQTPLRTIRAVANLYPEALHLVVRKNDGISAISDLAGRRVSLGEEKSGTRVLADIVLEAYGLSEESLEPSFLKIGPALDALLAGELDALFLVSGYPVSAVVQAAESGRIDLLHVMGRPADRIRKTYPYVGADVISEGTYPDVGGIVTLKVGALLVTSEALDADLVYAITRALWHQRNRKVLEEGPPNARRIQLHRALHGIAVPLHPGAARFYEEIGFRPMP